MTDYRAPLGGAEPLIDVHAHFHTAWSNRSDWQELNDARIVAGRRIGVRAHVASVLGSWGHTSPTYFSSPTDQSRANQWMVDYARRSAGEVHAYVAVNPNFTDHALREIAHGMSGGAVGIKLAAARRADDVLLNEIAAAAAHYGVPILQHVWQHRRRDWPNQDASDALDVVRMATRHPQTTFILAHIGGGGDWAHTFPAVRDTPNVVMDLSGSGIDRGMMDEALQQIAPSQLLWATDLTLCTGLTKLWALEHTVASAADISCMRWRNAVRIFPPGTFDTVVPTQNVRQLGLA